MEIGGMDISGVKEALDIAKNGLGVVKEAGGIASKLRDAFRPGQEPVPQIEILRLASDLGYKVLEAQAAQSEVMNRLLELERALEKAKQHELDAQHYQLVMTAGGSFVLEFVESAEGPYQPPHNICHPCFDAGKKMILQPSDRPRHHVCTRCKTLYRINPKPPEPPRPSMADIARKFG